MDLNMVDRFRGAVIGLAVGDCMGVPLEFKAPGTFEPVDEMVGDGRFGYLIMMKIRLYTHYLLSK